MENYLILSHLHSFYAQHQALTPLRSREECPPVSEIAELLIAADCDRARVWTALDSATRKAEVTALQLKKLKMYCVDFWSMHFPANLRKIPDPAWCLYFLGQLPSPVPTLAIVGSRRPSPYGHEVVLRLLPYTRTRPLQVISGLALGIDGTAHDCACECRIPNFAVLGSGLDHLYPTQHLELAQRILEGGGGLISELPPGTEPHARFFPQRNRLISGLSDVVWVVQGTAKSGSLHTARHALGQNKIVAVTPGDIFSELSEVPHRLLSEGATPVTQAADLDSLVEREFRAGQMGGQFLPH